jgi:hypothetical protein
LNHPKIQQILKAFFEPVFLLQNKDDGKNNGQLS